MYSASSALWAPAIVTQVQAAGDGNDILTVQFYHEGEPKQKSLYRGDSQLASIGAHTGGQLPPGFQVKPSQTRPGQLVYLDATTNVKYGNPELAWRVHFERLMQQPAAGCETVCAMPKGGLPAPNSPARSTTAQTVMGSPSHADAMAAAQGPRPISLAELKGESCTALQALGGQRGGLQGGPPSEVSSVMGPGGQVQLDLSKSGKIKLPSFGDAMGSQAAYLSYEGKAGADVAAAAATEAILPANTGHYPVARGTAPRRAAPPPKNPALHAWSEDPFSQWRR